MASIYDLKPKFQQLLQPAARTLYRLGVTANQVTLAAAIASLACGACLAWLIDRENSIATPAIMVACALLPLVTLYKRARNALASSPGIDGGLQ